MSVFLDAGYIIALHHENDSNHEKAVNLTKIIKSNEFGSIFTSKYVFAEVVVFTLIRQNHEEAIKLGDSIKNSEIIILDLSESLFEESWVLFKQRENLSFTDCTTVKLMKDNNIQYLATFDRGFLQFKEINVLM